jgi:hypothetical protein
MGSMLSYGGAERYTSQACHVTDAPGPYLPVSAHEETQCDFPKPAVQQWPQHLSPTDVGDADEAAVLIQRPLAR